VDESGEAVAQAGPFRMVVDGLCSSLTSKAIHALAKDGIAVLYGATDFQLLSLNPGFMLGTGMERVSATEQLSLLALRAIRQSFFLAIQPKFPI